ncbi:hypothetical protein N9048_01980 [bacterium]|nr:hypothetical protein [bacterium]
MNSRFLKTLLLASVVVGGIWVLFHRDRIREPSDILGLVQEQFLTSQVGFELDEASSELDEFATDEFATDEFATEGDQLAKYVTNVIRIASFKVNDEIEGRQTSSELELLADICSHYDAVAIQDINAENNRWLDRVVLQMNNADRRAKIFPQFENQAPDYTYVSDFSSSDPSRGDGVRLSSAVIFNRRTLVLNQTQWYAIDDPDKLLSHKPLVTCFKTRGPSDDEAFTFSLVNVKLGHRQPQRELTGLIELFRAIRNDGRGEDDVLIVGNFNGGDSELQPMRKRAGLTWVVSDRGTNYFNTTQLDNLVFNEVSTVEFTGRGGVFDFVQQYNLPLEVASKVSKHIPVWAEFSVFEGQVTSTPSNATEQPGRVAKSKSSEQH